MTPEEIMQELHQEARRHADWLRTKGFELVKKRLRFNEVVEVGMLAGRLGPTFDLDTAKAGVRDAVRSCCSDDDGGPILDMIQPWMISAPDPRDEATK